MAAAPRIQIASLFAGYGTAGVFWGAFAASTPVFQQTSGLDTGGFGLMLGAMSLTALPVMQVFGRMIGRIEALAIPLCMTAFALGCVMLGTAQGFTGLLAALMVLGGASGALDIALNNRTARLEEDTGARLFNRTHALFPFAMLVSSAATGMLRGAGLAPAAIFLAVAGLFAAAALAEARAGRHQRPVPEDTDPARARAPLAGAVALLAAIAALGAFQEMSSQSWAAIFVEIGRGAGPALAGLAPAAFTLGLSLGRLAAHGLEHRLTPMATVRLAACLAVPAFLGVVLAGPVWALLLVFLVAGMGVGPVEPAVFRAVARRSDTAGRGRMLATVTGVAYLGYLLSPPVLGQIAAAFGFAALWSTAALAAVAVALLTLALPRTR